LSRRRIFPSVMAVDPERPAATEARRDSILIPARDDTVDPVPRVQGDPAGVVAAGSLRESTPAERVGLPGSCATFLRVRRPVPGREEPAQQGTDEPEEGAPERVPDLPVVDERDPLVAPRWGRWHEVPGHRSDVPTDVHDPILRTQVSFRHVRGLTVG